MRHRSELEKELTEKIDKVSSLEAATATILNTSFEILLDIRGLLLEIKRKQI